MEKIQELVRYFFILESPCSQQFPSDIRFFDSNIMLYVICILTMALFFLINIICGNNQYVKSLFQRNYPWWIIKAYFWIHTKGKITNEVEGKRRKPRFSIHPFIFSYICSSILHSFLIVRFLPVSHTYPSTPRCNKNHILISLYYFCLSKASFSGGT